MSSPSKIWFFLAAFWVLAYSVGVARADKSDSTELILFEVTGNPIALNQFKTIYVGLKGEFDHVCDKQPQEIEYGGKKTLVFVCIANQIAFRGAGYAFLQATESDSERLYLEMTSKTIQALVATPTCPADNSTDCINYKCPPGSTAAPKPWHRGHLCQIQPESHLCR